MGKDTTGKGTSGEVPLKHRINATPMTYVYCLIPIVAGLIEIQFSGASWEFFYGLIRNVFGFLDSYYAATEQFVGDTTVAAILLVIWIYRRDLRHTIAPFLIALLLTSTTVNVTKMICGRARPNYGWKMNTEEMQEISAYQKLYANPVLKPEPGDYWMWFTKNRPGSEMMGWFTGETKVGERNHSLSIGDYSSFPSGHSSSAILLAAFLSHILPRAKWLWWILGIGCALSRIRNRRHYPGDVLVGSGIGVLGFYLIFSAVWPFQLGARAELMAYRIGERLGWRTAEESAAPESPTS